MGWIGRAYLDRSDYPKAQEWYQRCLVAADDIVPKEAANAWHQLATIDLYHGQYELARKKFKKSLKISRQINDRSGEAAAWHQLATIALRQGKYGPAGRMFEKSLKINQQIGYRAGEAATWHNLGLIDLHNGVFEPAREKVNKSLEILQQISDRADEAATWHTLASIDLRQGEYEPACAKFKKSLEISQQIGDRVFEANTFAQLGIMASQLGRSEEGRRLVALGSIILEQIGHADQKQVAPWVNMLASKFGYTEEQLESIRREVSDAYQKDRGKWMVEAIFGKSR